MEYKSQKHYQDVNEYFSATDHIPLVINKLGRK